MPHPFEQAMTRHVHALRVGPQPVQDGALLTLVPGVYVGWDSSEGEVGFDLTQRLEALIDIQATVRGTPEWLSLNIELGKATLTPGDIIGIVAELSGCAGHDMSPFLRSAQSDAFHDTYLSDRLMGSPNRVVRTLLHRAQDDQTGKEFHTLVLPLPKQDFVLALHDIRLFVVPASRGLSLSRPTISEY